MGWSWRRRVEPAKWRFTFRESYANQARHQSTGTLWSLTGSGLALIALGVVLLLDPTDWSWSALAVG